MTTAPSLPPRRAATEDDVPIDEPPPAYTQVADQSQEQTVDANFRRPFQEPSESAYSRPAVPPPPQRYTGPGSQQAHTGFYSPYQPLNPLPGTSRPPLQGEFAVDQPRPTPQASSSYSTPSSAPPLPQRRPDAPPKWEPSETPIPGQVLLRQGKILSFPSNGSHSTCKKCKDSGWKSFDPSNPCKKCWEKFGKPFTGALKIALTSSNPTLANPPPYTQAPLPPRAAPPPRPVQQPIQYQNTGQYQQPGYAQHMGYGQPQMNGYAPFSGPPQMGMFNQGPIVVQPGDPRIGGRLCPNCYGDGVVVGGFLLLDTVTCYRCGGSGRVFGY